MPPIGQNLLAALGMHWLRSDLRPGPRGGQFRPQSVGRAKINRQPILDNWITVLQVLQAWFPLRLLASSLTCLLRTVQRKCHSLIPAQEKQIITAAFKAIRS